MRRPRLLALFGTTAVGLAAALATGTASSYAADPINGTINGFNYGELNWGAGCGTNQDGEPTIHVNPSAEVFVGSERGLGGGSDGWTGASGTNACGLTYRGQPNAVAGAGASGGDIDSAWSSAPVSGSTYRLYVASLNGGSVSVAHSDDNGATWTNVPVQGGLPVDDREWIAAYGLNSSILTFHDLATFNIDVLRSDNGGLTYTQVSQAIPATDYKASNNELGNVVIDRRNTSGTVAGPTGAPGFWTYQSFVAPSSGSVLSGGAYNEAFLAVSNDGGYTWTDKPIPCSTAVGGNGLDHNFPNVSVAPNGSLWYAYSNDTNVYVATSSDHGNTWACSGPVSTNTAQAIFPWLVATSNGVDLAYYGSPTAPGKGSNQTWYVEFAQNLTSTATGWGAPTQLMTVHSGSVCEGGISCTNGRQLLDDFGIDTDPSGWARISYSHDAPDLGGAGTFTGYAVQTSGTPVGFPN